MSDAAAGDQINRLPLYDADYIEMAAPGVAAFVKQIQQEFGGRCDRKAACTNDLCG